MLSKSKIDNSWSVVDNSRAMLLLVASFTIVIYRLHTFISAAMESHLAGKLNQLSLAASLGVTTFVRKTLTR
jgi:hypothetical protein